MTVQLPHGDAERRDLRCAIAARAPCPRAVHLRRAGRRLPCVAAGGELPWRRRARAARACPSAPRPTQLAAERYLFYALCSRPTAWLRVSWHEATDAGELALRSLFVDELVRLLCAGPLRRTAHARRRARSAGRAASAAFCWRRAAPARRRRSRRSRIRSAGDASRAPRTLGLGARALGALPGGLARRARPAPEGALAGFDLAHARQRGSPRAGDGLRGPRSGGVWAREDLPLALELLDAALAAGFERSRQMTRWTAPSASACAPTWPVTSITPLRCAGALVPRESRARIRCSMMRRTRRSSCTRTWRCAGASTGSTSTLAPAPRSSSTTRAAARSPAATLARGPPAAGSALHARRRAAARGRGASAASTSRCVPICARAGPDPRRRRPEAEPLAAPISSRLPRLRALSRSGSPARSTTRPRSTPASSSRAPQAAVATAAATLRSAGRCGVSAIGQPRLFDLEARRRAC